MNVLSSVWWKFPLFHFVNKMQDMKFSSGNIKGFKFHFVLLVLFNGAINLKVTWNTLRVVIFKLCFLLILDNISKFFPFKGTRAAYLVNFKFTIFSYTCSKIGKDIFKKILTVIYLLFNSFNRNLNTYSCLVFAFYYQ